VFASLLSLSFAYEFVLLTWIPILDLWFVIVVACGYFDNGYYFFFSTHQSIIGVNFESEFTTILLKIFF